MDWQEPSKLRMLMHNQFGVIVLETWEMDEIAAAMEAISILRQAKRREADYREQKREEAA